MFTIPLARRSTPRRRKDEFQWQRRCPSLSLGRQGGSRYPRLNMRRPPQTLEAVTGRRYTPASSRRASSLDIRATSRPLVTSIAALSLLLIGCTAFQTAPLHPARCSIGGTSCNRFNGETYPRATRLPDHQPTTTVFDDHEADKSAVLDDLARAKLDWEGHEYGFDWYLEVARRGMETRRGGFSPLRMSFWRPTEEAAELSFWDTMYIILRNLGQMAGLPSVDNAPVAKIPAYKGSWVTFLQKVTNGRLEDLAGGPLFLMLEEYFKAEGNISFRTRLFPSPIASSPL